MLDYQEIKGFEEKEAIIEMWGVNDYSCVLLKHSKQSYYLNGKWIFLKWELAVLVCERLCL